MVIHLLKLIRSRLGGSCWILVELLVVFAILWFMMYYFVAQGMLTRMPVGFKLDHVYNVTLAIRPVRQSLVHRPTRRGARSRCGTSSVSWSVSSGIRRGGGRALVLFAALYRLEHRQQSLERLDQPAGAGNDRLAGVFPGVRHPLRYGRKPERLGQTLSGLRRGGR